MPIVVGPVLSREGGFAFDSWTPEEGIARGYTYRGIDDAYYARNVELKSRKKGYSDRLVVACITVDEIRRVNRNDESL
jgi:hypothetical protein